MLKDLTNKLKEKGFYKKGGNKRIILAEALKEIENRQYNNRAEVKTLTHHLEKAN